MISKLRRKPCYICKFNEGYCHYLWAKGKGKRKGCVQSCHTCIYGIDNQCSIRYKEADGTKRKVTLSICGNYAPINHKEVHKFERKGKSYNRRKPGTKPPVGRGSGGKRKGNGANNK